MLVVLVFYSGQGWPAAWQQAGSARVSTEYVTNPAMIPAYRAGGIWRSIFAPSYNLKRISGANELNAGLALQVARSSNQTLSQNRENPSVFLGWRQQSDTGELGLTAQYDEASTRYTQIDNIGSGFVDSTRASRTISGNWSQELSQQNTLSADGAYQHVSYKGGPFVDYANQSAGLKFSHAWNERNTLFFGLSHLKYVPVGGNPSSRVASAILGWEWKAAEYLGGSLQAGKTKSSDIETGTQGAATVRYTGQRTGLNLNAARQISPSGLGGFVTNDQVNGGWSYDLGERSRAGIDLGWRKNQSVTDIVSRTRGAWLQRNLNSFWEMRMNYLHSSREGGAAGGASSDMLGISLIYTHSDF